MFVGGVLASTGYALAPVSTREKMLYISSIATADDLTQRDLAKYPYFIRTGWTSSQPHHPLGQWACEQGYKKIVTIAADYAFGYESAGGFQKAFEDCGGKIIQKIWPPLGTKDFGPYIPTMKQRRRRHLHADGRADVAAIPQAVARRPATRSRSIGGGTSYDEFMLPSMGDEVIGDVSALQYSAALDTPKNAEFVKKYRAKYGKVPSYYSETNYTTAQMDRRDDEEDTAASGRAPMSSSRLMRGIKLDALRGPVSSTTCATRCRTSTSRRSRRRRCSATTRTSSGTR